LLYAIEREGKPSAGRVVALRRRALEGPRTPLGYRFVADVLQRMRVDPAKRTDLAALGLLRLCLNDLYHSTGEGEPMPASLDPQNPNTRAYLCGRLLAVHDDLQRKTFYFAEGSVVNSTVADRYYTLVMNSPSIGMASVFNLGRKHLAKLRKLSPRPKLKNGGYPLARSIEQDIGEIERELTEKGGIPSRFGMHDKAHFALGFYHQKAYRPKKSGNTDGGDTTEIDTNLDPNDYTEVKESDQ
jgi:CRISPR-associated protein Csd1